jgi:hypothetical protein
MAGTDIPTITEDTAMRDIVPADGIATVGVGIATTGIATKQGGGKLTDNWVNFYLLTIAIAPSEADNKSASVVSVQLCKPKLLDIENHGVL